LYFAKFCRNFASRLRRRGERVLAAANASGGSDAVGRLYPELGSRAHGAGGGFSEGLIATRHDGSLLAMSDSITGEVPPLRGRLQLWVAVATIVSEPTVFELKRHRSCRPAHAR
jgi:hypothetical protein